MAGVLIGAVRVAVIHQRGAVGQGVHHQPSEGDPQQGAVGAHHAALADHRREQAQHSDAHRPPARLVDGVGQQVDQHDAPDGDQHEAVERVDDGLGAPEERHQCGAGEEGGDAEQKEGHGGSKMHLSGIRSR